MNNAKLHSLAQDITFQDYFSYAELALDEEILQKLTRCYRTLFKEDTIWNEDYSEEDIQQKLQAELKGDCALRLCLYRDDVVGFCWVQSLDAQAIHQHINRVKYFQDRQASEAELQQSLNHFVKHTATYIHDLGIAKAYREAVALEQLIIPPLRHSFAKAGSSTLAFWSVEATCISHLAQKAGIKPFLKLDNMVFFCGDVPDGVL